MLYVYSYSLNFENIWDMILILANMSKGGGGQFRLVIQYCHIIPFVLLITNVNRASPILLTFPEIFQWYIVYYGGSEQIRFMNVVNNFLSSITQMMHP